ncbi:hypothetical protein [Clostridium estertheticum]|uniref:hypothetical protein n=1 Tax=Clostridium estertheticum TaxID=238834 RepID=UPI001C0D7B1E|nr:hypothetical protein [Clostridium estertheticum]MBU3185684.1 hypothetical protein [Clostridium estertheticum]
MNFYMERKGLLKTNFKINDIKKLKEYLLEIYLYYERKGAFRFAYEGIIIASSGQYREPPSMQPTPNIYFLTHLGKEGMFPIDEHINRYSIDELFTVIEMLYEHIAVIDFFEWGVDQREIQPQFRNTTNNILKLYNDGYYLNESGHILNLPNDAVLELINEDLPCDTPITVIDKVNSATKMFFHFSSTRDEKGKAICLLEDILEPLRKDLAKITHDEWDTSVKVYDKLLFELVNKYGLRHNKPNEINDYSKDIWHEWMFHFYLATVLAYYKLKEVIESKKTI